MAAFDTPWMASMTDKSTAAGGGTKEQETDSHATTAAFSPHFHASSTQQRSTILVHHKSPLLLATPPQVTRALAYSHPFIVPLNKAVGLLSWTTDDPWESFLLVAAFWFTVLYGDDVLRLGGPLVFTVFLILGMYYRRYSPLSSTGWTGEKQKGHKRAPSDVHIKHRKSLDEILSTLQTFTARCNILLDPMLRLTDFLSTQQTATSATTRPALTALMLRIVLVSPIWVALAVWPIQLITTRRVILLAGTLFLSWHSRPARISRSILWRSKTARWLLSVVTGLDMSSSSKAKHLSRSVSGINAAHFALRHHNAGEGIRFTFSVYENQRRWIGVGWTHKMMPYDRAPWTDEHLNESTDTEHFQLPEVESGMGKWQWVEGSTWHVATSSPGSPQTPGKKSKHVADNDDERAWTYYDNKWHDGQRGQDSWGRYTRRRKWVRDAELVDVVVDQAKQTAENKEKEPARAHAQSDAGVKTPHLTVDGAESSTTTASDADSLNSQRRKGWFGRTHSTHSNVAASVASKVRDKSPFRHRSRENRSQSDVAGTTASPTTTQSQHTKTASHDETLRNGAENKSVRLKRRGSGTNSMSSSNFSQRSGRSREDDLPTPTIRLKEKEADWGLGDDVSMYLE